MATDSSSLFDLSPSEKLQLVQDLWDDLAAAPSEVPVHQDAKRDAGSVIVVDGIVSYGNKRVKPVIWLLNLEVNARV